MKYENIPHQMYEHNCCDKFLIHMIYESASEVRASGPRGSRRIVNVVPGLQSIIILQTHKTVITRFFLLRNYH